MSQNKRTKNRNISAWLFFAILTALLGCKKNEGFFAEMPDEFICDSLTLMTDVFKDLQITKSQNGDVVQIECPDGRIQFCGYLKYHRDTIFYGVSEDKLTSPFLILNCKKWTKWTISYNQSTQDEVSYLGKRFDTHYSDSLHLFMLEPQKRDELFDRAFVKFISVGHGGIKRLTFGSSIRDVSIYLDKYPFVFREIYHN